MANTYTWYTDMNVSLPDGSAAYKVNSGLLWGLKALLKGEITGSRGINGAAPSSSYWTCVSSSDGTTANNTDLWGSTYDESKFTYGDNLSNYTGSHSWMVLRSPSSFSSAGYLYLLLLYAGPGSGQYVGGFVSNTTFSGGTAARRPSSTKEVSLYGLSYTSNMQLAMGSNTTGEYKLHFCRTANGSFWFAASKNGTGRFGRIIGVSELSETRSPEAQPWFTWWEYWPNDFNYNGYGGTGFWTSYAGNASRTHNDLYATELIPLRPYTGTEGAQANSFDRPATNTQGDLDAFPMYMFYRGSNQLVNNTSTGVKGKIPDVFISAYLPGAVYPTSGDVEKVSVGSLWLPFDVAPEL